MISPMHFYNNVMMYIWLNYHTMVLIVQLQINTLTVIYQCNFNHFDSYIVPNQSLFRKICIVKILVSLLHSDYIVLQPHWF